MNNKILYKPIRIAKIKKKNSARNKCWYGFGKIAKCNW